MLIGVEKQMHKVVGIVGGMGPSATALLFQKLIDYTDARVDSEHMHIIIDNNTSIPDRTTAILNGENTPAMHICESGKKLEQCGAELILIPCNTSHYFYNYIQEQLEIPVVNMIKETARECLEKEYQKIGVLCTTGTRNTKIYDRELEKYGISVLYPDDEGQKKVMEIIYDQVKAGKPGDASIIKETLKNMEKKGAQAFILACTELPMVIKDGDYGYCFIDSLDVLAKRSVELAGYKLKKHD